MSKNKSNNNNKGGGPSSEELRRDQKLQAVVLADSFTKAFRPASLDTPKVLMPLMNIPMLEYVIEFLTQNGVEELFIFCVWHAQLVQRYINEGKWPANVTIHCINSTCSSAGDALRELDQMGVIRSDPFVLISGDVISNMNLAKAIEFHKEKRKEDNNTVMTITLRPVQPTSGIKPVMDDLVTGIDTTTKQVIFYEDELTADNCRLPVEILAEHPSIDISTNLLDCHIDICSPELLIQFSDNFDYRDIRKDFIKNETVNWELGMHVYGYQLDNGEYAARIQDPRSYDAICRDVIHRWVFPLVCDTQLLPQSTSNYTQFRRHTYKEDNVKIASSATIGRAVVVGRGTIVEANTKILKSVVGRNCKIGANVVITNSHLWDGAVVQDGARVENAILGKGSVVRSGAVVAGGCVLASHTVVGTNTRLPPFTRVSPPTANNDNDVSLLGHDGVGSLWRFEGDDDYNDSDSDDDNNNNNEVLVLNHLRAQSIGSVHELVHKINARNRVSEPEESDEDDDDDDNNEDGNLIDTVDAKQAEALLLFCRNVADMVVTGHAEGHPADNVLMEIKGYKFSQNKSFAHCVRGAITGLVSIILNNATTRRNFQINISKVLVKGTFGFIVLKTLIQNQADELALIDGLEREALLPERAANLFLWLRDLFVSFYESKLISEETFLRWIDLNSDEDVDEDEGNNNNNNNEGDVVKGKRRLFQSDGIQEFVEFISQDEEDDDDDDDDEEEED